jgi:adenylosuccinate lyase
MDHSSLYAISPVDGRYRSKTEPLSAYFSEYGLIRYRVQVEIKYFLALCRLPLPELEAFPIKEIPALDKIYLSFTEEDALRIKEIEKTTNHDVKAVEYFLREKFDALGLGIYKEFIHFALTSQDINNTAIPLSVKDGITDIIIPEIESILTQIKVKAAGWSQIPMLARTHGQPASPTKLGKEFMVFAERIQKQLSALDDKEYYGKFGGATGNFNAHLAAYPLVKWLNFADDFMKIDLGLVRNQYTTQIDHYDDLADIFDNLRRINVIMLDFCRDIWMYISQDYFKQQIKAGEVGSSAMPHKVNPIDFENAEGNLGIANAIFDHLSNKLPVSRLQRDLTDSTVLRNTGVPLAHSLIAYNSILKGLGKLIVNEEKIHADLEHNWAVVAEAIQTILRKEGYPHPYDKLKEFTRGKSNLDKNVFEEFIDQLEISHDLKSRLKAITPFNYTGIY